MTSLSEREHAIMKVREGIALFEQRSKVRNQPQFDASVNNGLRVVDASSAGSVTFELDVGLEYSNRGGIMHGAAAALILDNFTTAAFLPLPPASSAQHDSGTESSSHAGKQQQYAPPGGVTRALSITYLRPLPLPSTVRVEAKIVQSGRFMSLIRGNIASRDGQKLYFTCEHHKVIPPGTVVANPLKNASKGLEAKL